MEIRYSPYNSPFIPAGQPQGIYWIGREYRHAPHDGHCQVYYRLVHAGLVDAYRLTNRRWFEIGGRQFVEGIDGNGKRRSFVVGGSNPLARPVAVLVTPPLCPMGGTFRSNIDQVPVNSSSAPLCAMGGTLRSKNNQFGAANHAA